MIPPPIRSRHDLRLTDHEAVRVSSDQINSIGRGVRQRPDPPRGVRFREGTVYWDAPSYSGNVTHYNVYVDTESNHVARVPSGQTSITGISGQRVFISSWNDISKRESRKEVLNGAIWGYASKTGGVRTHREIQAAIDGLPRDGGEVLLAPGEWLIGAAVTIPADKPGTVILGSGDATIVKRKQDIATGYGVFNVFAENCAILNMLIDGEVITSVGIPYGDASTPGTVFHSGGINAEPLHPTLCDNTSIRIHGGAKGVLVRNVKIQHTGGYAILICTQRPGDTDEDISDILIQDCRFENNRPHQFGASGDTVYGAWTGGVLYKNDGAANTKKIRNLTVTNCSWRRCMGNCLWGHANGFTTLNEQIEFTSNSGVDLGLDFIMPGNTIGGVVANNTARRVGYSHQNDSDTPVPKYYPGRYAVAIDTTGMVRGVNYLNNAALSVNGGLMDLDGYHDGVIAGNTLLATPEPTDAMYTEDQCASYGYSGAVPPNENITKGINLGSTYHALGSADVLIENNVIRHCGTHAIALNGSRRCLVKGNKIYHRTDASVVGIWGSPIIICGLTNAVSDTLLPADNVVTGNLIDWDMGTANPAAEVNFCVIESDSLTTALTSPTATIAGPNFVYDNTCLGNNFGEFRKSANSSGSAARAVFPSNDPAGTNKSQAIIQREGFATTAATKIYTDEAGVVKQRLQIADANNYLNVSDDGTAGTGGVVTGDRTTAAFDDLLFSGKLLGDAFWAIKKEGATGSTYANPDADLLDDTWALIRFSSGGTLQQSITTSAGARVWAALGGAGGSVAGSDKQVQFNDGGSAFGASANFTFDKTLQRLTVTGLTGTAGIVTATSFIQSAEGFYTAAVSAEAIKATGQAGVGAGGVACREVNIYNADGGATGWVRVIDGSRNAAFLAVKAELSSGSLAGAGNGTMSAENGFYTPVVSAEAVKVTGASGVGSGGVAARQINIYRADGGATGWDTVIDGSRNAAFNQVVAGTVSPTAGNGSMSAENGFYTPSFATDAIQVPNGTIETKYLYVTDGIQPFTVLKVGDPNDGGRITLQGATGYQSSFIDNVQGVLRMYGSGGLTYQVVQIWGEPTVAGLYLLNGYIQSKEGLLVPDAGAGTPSRQNDAINVPAGGVTASVLVASSSAVVLSASEPAGAAGQGKIWFDGSVMKVRNGTSGSFTIGSSSAAGSNTQVQFNNGGAFGASANFTWNGSTVGVTGNVNTSGGYAVGGTTAIDSSRNGALLAIVVGSGSITSVGSGTVTATVGYAVGSGGAGNNSIATFQNPTGGIDVKAVETDYLTLTPQASGIPSTVSGHTPSLKIWYNSASSRVEIGVSLYTPGISCEGNSVGGNNFRYWNGASYVNGASGSFTTTDGKTVTVNGGVITAIV